jgi:hypothetical protein
LNVLDKPGGKFIDKTFTQQHWDGTQWQYGLGPYGSDAKSSTAGGGTTWLGLYRHRELLAAPIEQPVWIPEGEKDTERLEEAGWLSITNLGGAGKWKDSYSEEFKGRACLLIPDNDKSGRDHAQKMARSLHGKAHSIKIVDLVEILPDLPAKSDVSDFLNHGGTVEQLIELARRSPEWQPSENGNGLITSNTLTRTPPSDDDGEEIEPPIVLPEWPAPLDEAAYFGLLGEIVRGVEKETEADPAAILTQLLVGFGNVIGRSAYARVGPAFHHTNESLLIIGQTSAARKGTAWSEVGRLLEHIDEEWWHRLGPGLSSGEGLIFHVRDKVTAKEAIKDKGGRVTEYQDVIVDHGIDDKRLMVVETEFARALQAMQREGSTLNSIVRQAFDGGLLRSLVKGFPYQATGAHISIIGHITVEELHKLLASTDLANGFTNRFLWIACRRARLLPFGGDPDAEMIKGFQDRLKTAVNFAKSVGHVRWTKDAMKLWEQKYELLTAPRPGALGGVVNRAEAHSLRVATLTALFNLKDAIELPHLQAALAIVDYSERSAKFVLGDRLRDREEAAILEYLKCKPQGATRTEIRRDVFHDNKPAHHVREKLASLLQAVLVRCESEPTEGRTAERWFSTPP